MPLWKRLLLRANLIDSVTRLVTGWRVGQEFSKKSRLLSDQQRAGATDMKNRLPLRIAQDLAVRSVVGGFVWSWIAILGSGFWRILFCGDCLIAAPLNWPSFDTGVNIYVNSIPFVVFDWNDEIEILPVTAYEVDE